MTRQAITVATYTSAAKLMELFTSSHQCQSYPPPLSRIEIACSLTLAVQCNASSYMAEIDTYFKAYSVLHNRSDAPMITVWLSKSLAAAVAEQPDCILL